LGKFFLNPKHLIEELALKRNHKKIVFTNGCFDLIHVGHVRYLKEAKSQGDILVVGLNTDASVKRLKGASRPLQTEAERAEILAAFDMVDCTVLFDEDTPEKLIEKLRPDVLVKGGDWPIDKIVGSKFVMSYGGQVKSLQFVDGHSTSAIIKLAEKS
jgi:D-beta-D-heptose 7-phosphate kinase/D-beta-D-heptose 1-phosphate adenosyltransferase